MDRFDEVTREIMAFVHEREWGTDHDPKNLLLAMVGEIGELAEILQWKSRAELVQLRLPHTRDNDRIRHERADVLIYLIELGDWLEVDLLDAVRAKLAINERNYPVRLSRGNHDKHPGLATESEA